MISLTQFQEYALHLPETDESLHFHLYSFRVKKKIFLTVNLSENRATLRLSLEMQDVFSVLSKGAVYPVPNKWGYNGWTHIDLQKAEWELCQDAILNAWWEVAPKVLREKYQHLISGDS